MEHEDIVKYPGALLLDEISKLPESQRERVNYTGVCSIISQEMAARAIHESIGKIIAHNEVEDGET